MNDFLEDNNDQNSNFGSSLLGSSIDQSFSNNAQDGSGSILDRYMANIGQEQTLEEKAFQKEQELAAKFADKSEQLELSEILKLPKRQMQAYDGDTTVDDYGQKYRLYGYDAFETTPDHLEQKYSADRQKAMAYEALGIEPSPDNIGNIDQTIYKLGEDEKNKLGGIIGDDEVYVREMGRDMYDRPITELYTKDGRKINDMMKTKYNTPEYKNGVYYGEKDFSFDKVHNKIAEINKAEIQKRFYDDDIGRWSNVGKALLIKTADNITQFSGSALSTVSYGVGYVATGGDNNAAKKFSDFIGGSYDHNILKLAQEHKTYETYWENKAYGQLSKDIKAGNWMGVLHSGIENIDVLAADSVAFMASMAIGGGVAGKIAQGVGAGAKSTNIIRELGSDITYASLVMHDNNIDYLKEHGEPASLERQLLGFGSALAIGKLETIFLKGLMPKSINNNPTASEFIVKSRMELMSKPVSTAMTNIGKGIALEATQESLEEIHAQMFVNGKVNNFNEVVSAGILGGALGGAFKVPGTTIDFAVDSAIATGALKAQASLANVAANADSKDIEKIFGSKILYSELLNQQVANSEVVAKQLDDATTVEEIFNVINKPFFDSMVEMGNEHKFAAYYLGALQNIRNGKTDGGSDTIRAVESIIDQDIKINPDSIFKELRNKISNSWEGEVPANIAYEYIRRGAALYAEVNNNHYDLNLNENIILQSIIEDAKSDTLANLNAMSNEDVMKLKEVRLKQLRDEISVAKSSIEYTDSATKIIYNKIKEIRGSSENKKQNSKKSTKVNDDIKRVLNYAMSLDHNIGGSLDNDMEINVGGQDVQSLTVNDLISNENIKLSNTDKLTIISEISSKDTVTKEAKDVAVRLLNEIKNGSNIDFKIERLDGSTTSIYKALSDGLNNANIVEFTTDEDTVSEETQEPTREDTSTGTTEDKTNRETVEEQTQEQAKEETQEGTQEQAKEQTQEDSVQDVGSDTKQEPEQAIDKETENQKQDQKEKATEPETANEDDVQANAENINERIDEAKKQFPRNKQKRTEAIKKIIEEETSKNQSKEDIARENDEIIKMFGINQESIKDSTDNDIEKVASKSDILRDMKIMSVNKLKTLVKRITTSKVRDNIKFNWDPRDIKNESLVNVAESIIDFIKGDSEPNKVLYRLRVGDGINIDPRKEKRLQSLISLIKFNGNDAVDDSTFFAKIIDESKNGKPDKLVHYSLAYDAIVGSVSSYFHEVNKYLNDQMELELINENNGNIPISTYGLAEEIGRRIMLSENLMLQMSQKNSALVYREIGMKILKSMASDGIIQYSDNGMAIRGNLEVEDSDKIRGPFVTGPVILIDSKNADSLGSSADAKIAGIISQLKTPLSIVGPSTEPTKFTSLKDIKLPKSIKDTLTKAQSEAMYIDPAILLMFKELNSRIKDKDKNIAGVIKELDSSGLFGTVSSGIKGFEDSDRGKTITRQYTITELILNIDDYADFHDDGSVTPKPLYFTPEIYRTGRWQYLQTVFNPQTDNFFSRHILRPKEYSITPGSDMHIQSLYNFNKENIHKEYLDEHGQINKEGKKAIAQIIQYLSEGNRNAKTSYSQLSAAINSKLLNKVFKGKSKWSKFIAFQDYISLTTVENGLIRTRHMTSPDATASGAIIQLLYSLSPHSPISKDILEKLRILKPSKQISEFLDDVYDVLIKDFFNSHVNLNDATYIKDSLNALIDVGAFNNIREIMKIPFLSKMYGSGDRAAISDIRTNIITELKLNKSMNSFMLKILPHIKTAIDNSIFKDDYSEKFIRSVGSIEDAFNSPDIKFDDNLDEMIEYVINTYLTKEFIIPSLDRLRETLINPAFGRFQNYNKDMYRAVEKISGNIKTLPLYVIYKFKKNPKDDMFIYENKDGSTRYLDINIKEDYDILINRYSKPLTSKRPLLLKSGATVSQEVSNVLTANVNQIHETDALTQVMQLENMQMHHSDIKSPFINLHDSTKATIPFNYIGQQAYRDSIIDIVKTIDVTEPMYYAALHSDSSINTDYIKNYINKSLEHRSKVLGDKNINKSNPDALYGDELAPDTFVAEIKRKTIDFNKKDTIVNNKKTLSSYLASALEQKYTPFFDQFLKKFYGLKSEPTKSDVYRFVDEYVEVNNDRFSSIEFKDNEISINIGLNTDERDASIAEIFEHEVYHAMTVKYLESSQSKNDNAVKYIKNIINRLLNDLPKGRLAKYENLTDAISYIMNMDGNRQIAEMSSMIAAETNVRRELESYLNPSRTKRLVLAVKRLVSKVFKLFKEGKLEFTKKDMKKFNEDTLLKATAFIASNFNNKEDTIIDNNTRLGFNKAGIEVEEIRDLFANYSLGSEFVTPFDNLIPDVERFVKTSFADAFFFNRKSLVSATATVIHRKLLDTSPIYNDFVKRTVDYWESSPALRKAYTFLTLPDSLKHSDTFYKLSGLWKQIQNDTTIKHDMFIEQLNKAMEDANFSDNEIKALNHMVSSAPFHMLQDKTVLFDILSEPSSIDEKINKLLSTIGSNDNSVYEKSARMFTGLFNPEEIVPSINYNPDISLRHQNVLGDIEYATEKSLLYILNAIKIVSNYHNIEPTKLLVGNGPVKNKVFDAISRLEAFDDTHLGDKPYQSHKREVLVNDIFEKRFDIEIVTEKTINNPRFSSKYGWNVLREPKQGMPGLVYREYDDYTTMQEGIGTNINYMSSEIHVPNKMSFARGVKYNRSGSDSKVGTIPLTYDEKKRLGLVENPSDTLYRTMAHRDMIEDSEKIREQILVEGLTKRLVNTSDLNNFEKFLSTANLNEIPWFVKLPDYVKLDKDEHKNIIKYYTEPEVGITEANQFRNNIDLVASHADFVLVGYNDIELGRDNNAVRNIGNFVKIATKLSKIAWTALNPFKIFRDVVSNQVVLNLSGVPPHKIAKYQSEAMNLIPEYTSLRVSYIEAKIRDDRNAIEKYKLLIENHPLSIMDKYGMFSSVNTELLERDKSVISGIEHEIDKYIRVVDKYPDSIPIKAIKFFMNFGYSLSDLVLLVGSGLKNAPEKLESVRSLGRRMSASGTKLDGIRKDNDVKAYFKEIFGLPGSEAVKWGMSAQQTADIIARYTYFKHLLDEGSPLDEAAESTLNRFINYNIVPPKEMKFIDDYGFLPFISFRTRIPLLLLRMLKENPVKNSLFISSLTFFEKSMKDLSNIHSGNIATNLIFGDRFGNHMPFTTPLHGADDVITPPLARILFKMFD